MNGKGKHALNRIKNLFDSQSLAVLATQSNAQPYASLVAFAATEDLKQIIFLTPNTTRKYANIESNFDEKQAFAADVFHLGRESYRLRDDDNIHLGRIEARWKMAV
jgi:hypothetical protein